MNLASPIEPSDTSDTLDAADQDAAIFADRRERKFFLSPDRAREFVDGLAQGMQVHRFRGAGASDLPRPVHFITTLYFDTYDRQVANECRTGLENLKLRAREYYDEHPDLTELVTSRRDLARGDRQIWLELKTKTDNRTQKIRFPMPADEVAGFLAGGIITQRAVDMQLANAAQDGEALLMGIWRLCKRVGKPLRPDSLVHYRRRAWQSPDASLRLTLDTQVSYHRPAKPYFRDFRSLRDTLSEHPVDTLEHYLVEIKARGDQPAWLRELGKRVGLRPALLGERQFSKFLAASDAVHREA